MLAMPNFVLNKNEVVQEFILSPSARDSNSDLKVRSRWKLFFILSEKAQNIANSKATW